MRMILKYIQAKERMMLFRKAKQIVELAEMSSSDWRGQFQQVLTISVFDNYFTSPELQIYLAKQGILSVGTVRSNRIPQCSLQSEVHIKRLEEGPSTRRWLLSTELKSRQSDGMIIGLLPCYQPMRAPSL